MAADLGKVWERIARWHRDHLPKSRREETWSRELLRPGADAGAVAAAEEAIGLALPAEVRESYLLHDGSDFGILPWGYSLLSLFEVVKTCRMWQGILAEGHWDGAVSEPKGPIKRVHWNPRWVPVAENGGGDYQCLDLDPAVGGSAGQVIDFSHEVGPLCVLAGGFTDWLVSYADGLESGRYRYDKDERWVVPVRTRRRT
jgi:cell wall assembly regulator SMI1